MPHIHFSIIYPSLNILSPKKIELKTSLVGFFTCLSFLGGSISYFNMSIPMKYKYSQDDSTCSLWVDQRLKSTARKSASWRGVTNTVPDLGPAWG